MDSVTEPLFHIRDIHKNLLVICQFFATIISVKRNKPELVRLLGDIISNLKSPQSVYIWYWQRYRHCIWVLYIMYYVLCIIRLLDECSCVRTYYLFAYGAYTVKHSWENERARFDKSFIAFVKIWRQDKGICITLNQDSIEV